LTFSLPFLPLAKTMMHASDIVGLIVISTGIILYRFSDGMTSTCLLSKEENDEGNQDNDAAVDVDDWANNSGTAAANREQALDGVVGDDGLLENDQVTNNGQDFGGGKGDPLMILIQPLPRTGPRIASI
jgi:hypothetical protein